MARAVPPPKSTFDKILLQGIRSGQAPARSEAAKKWFRDRAREETSLKDTTFVREDASRLRAKSTIGSMYFFGYDPKHKATLPHYDQFPLIFPVERYKDGFLGINLHYLPYKQRAMLMDALYSLTNNTRYDESTKLGISYQILKKASEYALFKPCVKRYLSSHVRTRFVSVHSTEWDIALFLPLANFQKQTQAEVWKASLEKLK